MHVLGFQTHRDSFAVGHTEEDVSARVVDLVNRKLSDDEVRERYSLKDNRDWQLSSSRATLRSERDWRSKISKCLYRPFDVRYTYLDKAVSDYPRRELLDHVKGRENICILASRQQAMQGFKHAWITSYPAESCAVSNRTKEQNYAFPVFLFRDVTEIDRRMGETRSVVKTANVGDDFSQAVTEATGLAYVAENEGDGSTKFGAEVLQWQ